MTDKSHHCAHGSWAGDWSGVRPVHKCRCKPVDGEGVEGDAAALAAEVAELRRQLLTAHGEYQAWTEERQKVCELLWGILLQGDDYGDEGLVRSYLTAASIHEARAVLGCGKNPLTKG